MTDALRNLAWLRTGGVARVLDLLDRDGEEARVVGGAVRNALLGLPVGEFDIATTARPDEVIRRASRAGIKSVPTGIDYGTVTLVIDGAPFEVTTLREDVETFGRKAVVAFGRDWARDARRRDFTINGLSVGRDGVVHDHVEGIADIATRRIRFIGDPAQRIAEDYLRILRFFRIHAAYGTGAPDSAGVEACIAARDGLAMLSAERIQAELLKLVVARGASDAVVVMADGGLLLRVAGGITYGVVLSGMIAAEAALGLPPDAIRRLAALTSGVREDASRVARRLRLSGLQAKRIETMADRWSMFRGLDDFSARRMLYELGPDAYRDCALLAWARTPSRSSGAYWTDIVTLPERWTAPVCPLRAADFKTRGIEDGPALGHILRDAERAWMAADFPAEKAALAAIAEAAIASYQHDHRL